MFIQHCEHIRLAERSRHRFDLEKDNPKHNKELLVTAVTSDNYNPA
ncbi:MAG: hypothetical protein KAT62_07300 [Desulfuromonadales bacterium]|nr:hypothetical protein [Desulfuromonadales bacterium]